MKKTVCLVLLFFTTSFMLQAQLGCTDPQANNFDSNAMTNDGSCIYPATMYQMNQRAQLVDELEESSGAAYIDGQLWVHNDGGNSDEIYRIDTLTGAIEQTILVAGYENEDWEDMTQSDNFMFLGDVGNNPGNRTDLSIARIDKNNLTNLIVNVEVIHFSYSDQTDFTERFNNNDYDCEAFFFYQDTLHLFTKNWVDEQTRHYTLPATPGTHVAQLRETFDTEGLITGAAIDENGTISLLGYTPGGVNFMWLLYDYPPNHFFAGNTRKINLGTGLTNSQTEGIVFTENGNGFVVSEKFNFLPPRLLSFSTSQWTEDITTDTDDLFFDRLKLTAYPTPFTESITLNWSAEDRLSGQIKIFDILGNSLLQQNFQSTENTLTLDLSALPTGQYLVKMTSERGQGVRWIYRK